MARWPMQLSVSDWSTEHKISYLPSICARERGACQASESTHTTFYKGYNAECMSPYGAVAASMRAFISVAPSTTNALQFGTMDRLRCLLVRDVIVATFADAPSQSGPREPPHSSVVSEED